MRPETIMLWLTLLFANFASSTATESILVPVIDGPWWQVAGDPDLGPYTREKQQPVDFGVWQAADGTWQLWSCIRGTGCGGNTRLFYRWEGQNLTDEHWKPMGIAMEAQAELGETPGGLQAPHVVRHEGVYHMAYGDWVNICFAISKDGKEFERVIQPDGKTGVFSEGPGCHSRDAMLIQIDGLWHCYYTAYLQDIGYGFCRTSRDLKTWGHSSVVSYGGRVGPGKFNNECPHVVEAEPGVFYYFRTQFYGKQARNWVYRSTNPLNFGIDEDSKLVRNWRLAAPEIVVHQGQYYIAALRDDLKGIQIAKLKWVRTPQLGESVFDFDSDEARAAWTLKSGDLASVFTNANRSDFNPATEYFIGTAELGDGQFDDARTGVIESPVFALQPKRYLLSVSGGKDVEKVYVALIHAETGKEIARVTGENRNAFQKYPVDVPATASGKAYVRIVDQATAPWGHINFGGMYEDSLSQYIE
ncbi:MAG: hypothetical protein KJ000_10830 [Pirellulaceae bacterium]|nr:hypothetical protein [Pirellulaceae bacterium]